jgi:hypothetical protein
VSAWEHPSRDLFRAGRRGMAPTTADRERVRARLAVKLGAPAVGAAITTTSATAGGATAAAATATGSAAKSGIVAFVAKIAIPLLLIGGAATVAAPHLTKKSEPPVAVATSTTPVVTPSPATAPVVPPPVETATVSVSDLPTAATAPPRAKTIAPASDPVEEARMVAAIDDALRANDPARALRLADDHAKKFPSGVLVQEREGGRAIARCMSGSRASADAFLAAHPRSPMRDRIAAACGAKQ